MNMPVPADETPEVRVKRLKMRSMRRGIKEMDILLGGFADANLATLSGSELDLFEAVLDEADQDLLAYVTHLKPTPLPIVDILKQIVAFAEKN